MDKGSSSSSASAGGGGGAADSHSHSVFNGLNFGKKIYFEGLGSGGLRPRLPAAAAEHPRSPAKKGRTAAAVQGGQPPRCQVEGCNVDLSGTKAYYCRHKVCGMHSKSSEVIVAGLHQRFCQQCSRFHQLAEFDQGKRSCRRRLAGHNERRRKPPPLSSSSSYTTSLYPLTFDNRSKSGAILMDFSGGRNLRPNNNNTITRTKYEQEDDDYHLLEGSVTRHSYRGAVISSEGSSSTSALSLLSNPVAQFSWGFKRNNINNNNYYHLHQQQGNTNNNNSSTTTLHEMAPPHMLPLATEITQYSDDDEPSRRFHQPSDCEGRY